MYQVLEINETRMKAAPRMWLAKTAAISVHRIRLMCSDAYNTDKTTLFSINGDLWFFEFAMLAPILNYLLHDIKCLKY